MPRRPAEQDLLIQALKGLQGVELCLARRIDARYLDVQLVGTPAVIRRAALHMLKGPLDADFNGQALRLMHFTIYNQNDRTRLVFTAEHAAGESGEEKKGLEPAGR